jgi:dynein heavy chain
VLEEGHSFSLSGTFISPSNGDGKDGASRDMMTEHVKEWPVVALPEAFGMHANADIAKDKQEMLLLLENTLLTQSQSSNKGGGKSRDEVVADLAADIAPKVPPAFDIELVQRKYPIIYHESMNTVLKQELIRYNRLMDTMRKSLKSIALAMKGLIVLSAELDEMATQMFNNQTPALWKKKCYPTLKPMSSFVMDFVDKMNFFQSWIDNGQPISYWISGIYFTHALLTGALQNYARKYNLPIDLVVFDFQIQATDNPKDMTSQPEDGIYIHGLYLEGAVFNYEKMELDESKPKVLYGVVPIIWYNPVHSDKLKELHYPHYKCPIYRTLDRRGTLATTGHSTNFVMLLRMPSSLPESHWIKRGTAMFCALAD